MQKQIREFFGVRRAWLCVALVIPMGVAVRVPVDSSSTSSVTGFRVGAGGGSFTMVNFVETCEGRKAVDHTSYDVGDVGAEVFHRFGSGPTIGVRGGYIEDSSDMASDPPGRFPTGIYYAGPYVVFGAPLHFLRVGALVANGDIGTGIPIKGSGDIGVFPSFTLRAPLSSGGYLLVSWRDDVPLTITGASRGGFGFGVGDRADLWFGLTGGSPFSGIGVGSRVGIRATRDVGVSLGFRVGLYEGKTEYGGGVGLQYLWRHSP